MRVAVAIVDSEESINALKWVHHYVPYTQLTLLHVMEPIPRPFRVVESATRAQAQEAARILGRAYEMCKDKMNKAENLILESDPKNMLCEATEKMNIDLLAVGSRGLGQKKKRFWEVLPTTGSTMQNALCLL